MASSSLVTRYIRLNNAVKFIEAFNVDNPINLYLFISRSGPWSGNTVPAPENTIENVDYDYWRYMLGGKKIINNDTTHAVERYDWTSNTVYRQYDSKNPNLFDVPAAANTFYVLTSDNNVYKCLFNNNGKPSTEQPTGTSTGNIVTTDGYIWKFMYNISSSDDLKFTTPDYMSVQTLLANNGTAQWSVQEAAVPGALDVVEVTDGGSGYLTDIDNPAAVNTTTVVLGDDASSTENIYNGSTIFISQGKGVTQLRNIVDYDGINKIAFVAPEFTISPNTSSVYHIGPSISIRGDGVGATAYANVINGEIEKINIISSGVGYTYANASITANSSHGSGANAYPIIPPPGGHGRNAIGELNGKNVTMNINLSGGESNTLITNNDFHQVGIVINPKDSSTGEIANTDVFDQTVRLTLDTTSDNFIDDERIVGQETGTVAYVVDFANTNSSGTQGVLSVTNVSNGDFQIENISAANSGVSGAITSITLGDLQEYTGDLLFLQNRDSIERTPEQTEDFKFTVRF